MPRLRGIWPAVLLTFLGTLAGLGVLEAGARLFAVVQDRRQGRLDRDFGSVQPPRPGALVTLGQIIRRSDNPRIVYDLRPRLDVSFAGARVTTSDEGYRGADVPPVKGPGTIRLVGIGDSYMFGQGVADEETYLARLAATWGDSKLETVNLAVPGYNTVMEVETLKARGAALNPDLVLIEIVGNDLDLPNFLWNTIDPWATDRLFLLDFVRTRLARTRPAADGPADLVVAPTGDGPDEETFSRDADHVPARYRSLVGLTAFNEAMSDLAGFGRARGIPVYAVTHGVWFEDAMLKALQENQIPVLILRSALRQRAHALGAPDYARSPLALSERDLHPSALGHQEIAVQLASWLRDRLKPARPD